MATFSGSKLHVFLTYIVRKTIAMGVAEFQRVICAELGGVFANFTATTPPTFKSFSGEWGRFFKKAPTFFT